jgi:protein TonB
MPRDLFDAVTHPPMHTGGRSGVTVSLAAHAAVLAAIVVVPLVATDVLPVPDRAMTLIMTGAVLPPESPRPVAPPSSSALTPVTRTTIPLGPPPEIAPEPMARPPADLGEVVPGAIFSGSNVPGDGDGRASVLTPPPPPPPEPVAPRHILHVGGTVIAPAKIADVAPVYPVIARAAGVQGTVLLQATIGLDGRVEDVQVLRSVPLLDEAAVTAVRQWRYTPTRLNGQPVAVVMTVTVGFRLR